ncbi:MAG: hypothetical protein M1834_007781 [Cirrosporium novae-zelandiae]|nr:MAG: hypothetical protein M1834_007781 [Cirrosporium novae-zelandiae]
MSAALQTPQRPVPGAFMQTPAVNRQQQQPFQPTLHGSHPNDDPFSRDNARRTATASAVPTNAMTRSAENLSTRERAAKTINETLAQDGKYPEIDTYLPQGFSSTYDVSGSSAWAPFQRTKIYSIPDQIFDQYNQAQVATMMGLFAELGLAWVTIDNALYVWDYKQPDPTLIGFEDQPNTITAVRLSVPRAGVFVPTITHMLVIATTSELLLIGMAYEATAAGAKNVSLYQTHMSIAIRGMDVNVIGCSDATGRVFFSGRGDDDVHELTYQQEERWFYNRCGKLNHTSKGIYSLKPTLPFGQQSRPEHIIQMVVDDSRNLLYTLSSASTIRTFHMKSGNTLDLVITKPLPSILSNAGHMTPRSDLIAPGVTIVNISAIPASEASKLHLMATLSNGCRLYLTATTVYGWSILDSSSAPTSMQVQHIKYPPVMAGGSNMAVATRLADRFPPGYFLCFTNQAPGAVTDSVFLSSPDTGRIAASSQNLQAERFPESAIWLSLESRAEDIGLESGSFAAGNMPIGFGNELAVQFDKPPTEIAILTNTGVHTIRRRRLVDVFASAIRFGGGDEGLEGEIKKFIRLYGRGETIATALAVACGQGLESTPDTRIARVSDAEVLDYARRTFIEYGGRPFVVENSNLVPDQAVPTVDMVRPSARHDGIAIYSARLVRSIWRALIITEIISPQKLEINSTINIQKLRDIQHDLTVLQEFLNKSKSFIDGLSGPDEILRAATRQEEVSLQAEHRALKSLVILIGDIIEGISFVLVLFDERVEDIIRALSLELQTEVKSLTYEKLFCTARGKDLAKELVKAIVNRNIASGSNVDTVAEALRRRCGSFCSAEDVVVFKAQEQVKKASEVGSDTEFGRNLLNESLRLFEQVAANISMEYLEDAVQEYTSMRFFAGAVKLALAVAKASDPANKALAWMKEERQEQDPRKVEYDKRRRYYNLIHQVIVAVDEAARQEPEMIDGQYTTMARRKQETYDVVNNSDDEVFHTDLYDWYLEQGWNDRLLNVQSPYITAYLQMKSVDDVTHADLLWKYYVQNDCHYEAADVQLQLAKSAFKLPLDRRIEYLSRAKANASSYSLGVGRQPRQVLLQEISDLLDMANIQDELYQRLRGDTRLTAESRGSVERGLNGPILTVSELYNEYADQASYYDICLMIYQAADHRNPADIRLTWQNLFEKIHMDTVAAGQPLPYEAMAAQIRTLGNKLSLSETTFPINDILPMLERYAFEYQRAVGPATWVIDLFLELQVPYETLLPILESMFYNDEAPFTGPNRRVIADDMIYVIRRWFQDSGRGGGTLFGNEIATEQILDMLQMLQQSGLDANKAAECQALKNRIEQLVR